MKKVFRVSKVLLGLIYFIFGLNGFFNFIPAPELSEPAGRFIGELVATGYMLYFWKSIEVVSGFLFLINKNTLFAALAILPISANIITFHLFLDIKSLPLGAAVFILNIIILINHKELVKKILSEK